MPSSPESCSSQSPNFGEKLNSSAQSSHRIPLPSPTYQLSAASKRSVFLPPLPRGTSSVDDYRSHSNNRSIVFSRAKRPSGSVARSVGIPSQMSSTRSSSLNSSHFADSVSLASTSSTISEPPEQLYPQIYESDDPIAGLDLAPHIQADKPCFGTHGRFYPYELEFFEEPESISQHLNTWDLHPSILHQYGTRR